MGNSLNSVLSRVLAGNPGGEPVALLVDGRPPLNWAGLTTLASDLVSQLRAHGAGFGDRIGLLMPDGADMAFCALAAMEAGTCVPLNPAYPAAELEALLSATAVSILIVADTADGVVAAAEARGILVLRLDREGWRLRLRGAVRVQAAPVVAPASDTMALLLLTSGSTARPKLVPLTHRNLIASIENLIASLALTPADRCLNMMPMFHVGGLIDLFLAPLAAGGSVICAPRISASAFYERLDADAPTWFQGVPTVLREILTQGQDQGRHLRATGLRFIRSVSSALPEPLLRSLEGAFAVPVIEIFGMTETSGVVASNPLPPQARKPGSVGIAAGPEVRVLDATGNAAPAGRTGEIVIRGPTVTAGYLNREFTRADSFVGDWLRTGDEGHLDAEGYLFVSGRIKEIINRGGEKISPRQIDDLMAGMPGIREAAAYATPHPTLGEEVALAVVLTPGAAVSAEDIRAFLAPHLAAFKVPKVITFLSALPRVPSGKLDRKAIPASIEALRAGHAAAAAFAPPVTAMEKRVAAMWRKVLGAERVGPADNFFDLGGDSLTATTFIVDLEATLNRPVPAGLLFEAQTLGAFAAALDRTSPAPAVPASSLPPAIHDQVRQRVAGWKGSRAHPEALIVGRNTLGAAPALFWGVTEEGEFALLGQALDANRPLYAMRSLSKLRTKSEANTRLLAAHYADEVEAIQPEGAILIGGFCEGGKLAFHTAEALVARGREIKALLLHNRFVAEAWGGPVSMFWGKTPWLNAHDVNAAERGWNRYYSGSLSVQTLPYEHGDVYVPGHVDVFARQIEAELARIEAGAESAYARQLPLAPPLPAGTYAAKVSIRAPVMAPADAEMSVPVTVRNAGTETWQPSVESGIVLCASWRNFDGYARVPLDGYAAIERPVAPGGTFTATLRLRVPRTRLPMQLHVDLFEEGVGWFAERGGRSARSIVLPLPNALPLRGSRRAG